MPFFGHGDDPRVQLLGKRLRTVSAAIPGGFGLVQARIGLRVRSPVPESGVRPVLVVYLWSCTEFNSL